MKITPQQLKSIINEEIRRVRARRSLAEALTLDVGDLYEVDAEELIAFAKAYRDLGEAVTEQLDTIIEFGPDADADDVNPKAIDEVVRTLGGVNAEIDEKIADWQASSAGGASDEAEEDEPFSRPLPRR